MTTVGYRKDDFSTEIITELARGLAVRCAVYHRGWARAVLPEAVAVEVLAQTMVRARFVGYWFDQLGQDGQAGAGQQPRGGTSF